MFTTFAASTVSPWITSNLYFGLLRQIMNRLVQSHFVALAHARTQHLFVAQSRHTNTFRLVFDPPTNTQVIFAVESTAFITALRHPMTESSINRMRSFTVTCSLQASPAQSHSNMPHCSARRTLTITASKLSSTGASITSIPVESSVHQTR